MSNPFNKAISWYFSKRALPYWSILIVDCLTVVFSLLTVHVFARGGAATLGVVYPLLKTLLLYLICFLAGFRLFHTYSGVIRFSSFNDLLRVAFACLAGLVLSVIVQSLFARYDGFVDFPFSWLLQGSVLAMCLMWGVRIWVKCLYDNSLQRAKSVRAFIYGAKQGGIALAKSINNQEKSPYIIAGFVSDFPDIQNKRLMGVRVYPNDARLTEIMDKHYADVLLVSPLKSDDLRRNNDMVNRLIAAGIKILMIPHAQEWDGKTDFSYTQLKEINVEDLLPRDKIEIDMEAVGRLLSGRRILITGAAGSIGSEMARQIAPYVPAELILVDQAETPLHDVRLMMASRWPGITTYTIIADIADRKRMEKIFRLHRPEYVFHAAAYKHVPMMEENPAESIRNNVNGTCIVADLAVSYHTKKFVMVSTDKAVNPTNVMGCSKRICEIYVQSLDKAVKEKKVKGDTQFVTTRFGNVLGSNGSVIPLFQEQIKHGGPVTVTHPDIIRYFMLIPEACKLVLEAGTMGKGGEIFVFDMGNPVRIADLAKRMIRMSGAEGIEIKYIGLREGEKLYEEVLNKEETTLPTFHPKIKIAKVREYDYESVNESISELIERSVAGKDMAIVKRMKQIVPEFKSLHSKYEVLDSDASVRPEGARMPRNLSKPVPVE